MDATRQLKSWQNYLVPQFCLPSADKLANINMADDADSQYNNSNRAFLQAFIARSTLTFEEAKPLLAAIFTAHGEFRTLHCENRYEPNTDC